MERLDEKLITKNLESNPNWERVDDKTIKREYRFKRFLSGIRFVEKIAIYAEEKNHHPFISIDYKVVTLMMSSWEVSGLTILDFEMVARFDMIFNKIEE